MKNVTSITKTDLEKEPTAAERSGAALLLWMHNLNICSRGR